jgi:hypothetical protein
MKLRELEKMRPDREDYDAVRREYPLPPNPTAEELAHRYRLAVAHQLIRLYRRRRL